MAKKTKKARKSGKTSKAGKASKSSMAMKAKAIKAKVVRKLGKGKRKGKASLGGKKLSGRLSKKISKAVKAKKSEVAASAKYVDGFVVPVPKKNVKKYLVLAKLAGKVWKEHGALEYIECLADDVKKGKVTSFPQSVKLKPGEVVFFSWIVYNSRQERDAVNAKVMKDPRLAKVMNPKALPFDGKRMFWGGFKKALAL